MSETEESFYVNDEQMFKALVACYDPLQYSADAPLSPVVPFGEIRSDNARTGGGSDQDQPDMQDIEAFRNTSVNSISEVAWNIDIRGYIVVIWLLIRNMTAIWLKYIRLKPSFCVLGIILI